MIKKMFAAMAITAVLMSCGGGDASKGEEKPANAMEDLSSNPVYKEGLELVAGDDCLTCHKVSEKLTGPAYADIAAKYAGADDVGIDSLAKKIIAGGSGNWGAIPMSPHAALSEEDAKKMVKYILLLKK